MLIILEGVDCSGKTTVAHRLNRILPRCIYVKNGAVPYNSTDEHTINALKYNYSSLIEFFIKARELNLNVVMDRFFISELVYSKIKRDYEAAHDPYYAELSLKLEKLFSDALGGLIVYVDTPLPLIIERIESRGEDFVKIEEVQLILDRYNQYFTHTSLPHIRIPGTDEGFQMLLKHLTFAGGL